MNTEDNITTDPKNFWHFIKSKKDQQGIPLHMKTKDVEAKSLKDICDMFAEFFSSAYARPDSTDLDSSLRESLSSEFDGITNSEYEKLFKISEEDVIRSVQMLKNKYTSSLDNVPMCVYKQCIESLSKPLSIIFNLSLSKGIYPKRFLTSYVSPIHKNGPRDEIGNYRGVAELGPMAKILDHIMNGKILNAYAHKIVQYQHGFTNKRSTMSNLIQFTNKAVTCMESGSQYDTIYFDLVKAFDRVNVNILLRKLLDFRFNVLLIKWLYSYLSNRTQIVKIGSTFSPAILVTSGVGQGTHIGPTLFLFFINDLRCDIGSCDLLLYADDIKLSKSVGSTYDCELLQQNINRITDWCFLNRMEISFDKTVTVTYHYNKHPIIFEYKLNNDCINRCNKVKDLGLYFDNKITFSDHIEKTVAKCRALLGFIFRVCSEFKSTSTYISLYNSFVRSKLEYCSPVFSPFYKIHSDKIESVQRRFTFLLWKRTQNPKNYKLIPDYDFRCMAFNLNSLRSRRDISSILFISDILVKRIDSPYIFGKMNKNDNPYYNLRSSRVLNPTFHRTNYGMNEPITRMVNLFNKCNCFDESISRNGLKSKLFSHKCLNNY